MTSNDAISGGTERRTVYLVVDDESVCAVFSTRADAERWAAYRVGYCVEPWVVDGMKRSLNAQTPRIA